MAYMIQDFTLGGLVAKRNFKELVLGWRSQLIKDYGHKSSSDYTDYYYKTGDAIIYNDKVVPFLDNFVTLNSPFNSELKVNTGATDPTKTGLIETISGYSYPNKIMKVNNGQSSYEYLPLRCSDVNFTTEDVYSWSQGQPGVNMTSANVLNYVNMQVTKQEFSGESALCVNGTGAACAEAYGTYNNETQRIYAKTAEFYPNGNCGSRIFAHGIGNQQNTQDVPSGLPSAYTASASNQLSYDALATEAPGTNGPQMLHPFVSLKTLYMDLGANQNIPLSRET